MIDLTTEQPVSFSEAIQFLPRRRAGKPVNIATMYRWTTQGIRGVTLEFVQIGATRCTSREALGRFFTALTAKAQNQPAPQASRLTAARRKQIEATEKRLVKAGV
jgi:hypothetical protein